MNDNDFTLGPSAAFGMNVSTTQHPVGQFEPDPRDARIAELEAALKLVDDYFAPWGSWKTAWWEFEVGDDKPFNAEQLLREIQTRVSALRGEGK